MGEQLAARQWQAESDGRRQLRGQEVKVAALRTDRARALQAGEMARVRLINDELRKAQFELAALEVTAERAGWLAPTNLRAFYRRFRTLLRAGSAPRARRLDRRLGCGRPAARRSISSSQASSRGDPDLADEPPPPRGRHDLLDRSGRPA